MHRNLVKVGSFLLKPEDRIDLQCVCAIFSYHADDMLLQCYCLSSEMQSKVGANDVKHGVILCVCVLGIHYKRLIQ